MNPARQLSLDEWDVHHAELLRGGLREPFYGGALSRHIEGEGDLRGMRAVVDRFGESVCGYLILEGMALGQIYYRGLGVQRRRVGALMDIAAFVQTIAQCA